jgi:hypothetical protein
MVSSLKVERSRIDVDVEVIAGVAVFELVLAIGLAHEHPAGKKLVVVGDFAFLKPGP